VNMLHLRVSVAAVEWALELAVAGKYSGVAVEAAFAGAFAAEVVLVDAIAVAVAA